MMHRSLTLLLLCVVGCASPTEPTGSTGPASLDLQASEPLAPVAVPESPRSWFTILGPNKTCVPVSQLPKEWGVGVDALHPDPVRVRVEAIYHPIAGCANVTAPPDGDGRLTNISAANGADSFKAGIGGNAWFKLDTAMTCGRVEYHAWVGSQMVGWLHSNAGVNCAPPPPHLVACPSNPKDIWAKLPKRGEIGRFTDGRYVMDLAGYLNPEYASLPLVLTSWQKDAPGKLLTQTLKGQVAKGSNSDMAVTAAVCSAQVDLLVCPGAIPQKLDGGTFPAIDRVVAFADWNQECR